jgi:lipoprotein-anchoring transpeptidase ErfK/SrfK
MRRLDENQKAKALRSSALLLVVSLLNFTPAFAQSAREVKAKTAKTVQRQIIVSIPDRQLALLEEGRVLKIYSVAVGAEASPSPEGEFTVMSRLENPTYYKPGTVIAAGKNNPLGTRWMGLNKKGYGIHGTNLPNSIGKAASHGCIRMRQKDLEELFAMVRVGDKVQLRGQRDSEIAQIFAAPSGTSSNPVVLANASSATETSTSATAADAAIEQEK